MNEHYVYFYIDPRNGKIFYIGQGKGKRMFVHLLPSKLIKPSLKNSIIKEILAEDMHPTIAVVESGLSEEESLRSERKWIAFYGKENLTNKTTGGQGVSGIPPPFQGKHHTAEAREKIRQSKIGSKNPMFGKKRTAEALKKFREKVSGEHHYDWGKHRDEKTRRKISDTLKGFQWSELEKEKRRLGMFRLWENRRQGLKKMPNRYRKMIQCGEENLSLDEWAIKTKITKATIAARLRRGWSIQKALGKV